MTLAEWLKDVGAIPLSELAYPPHGGQQVVYIPFQSCQLSDLEFGFVEPRRNNGMIDRYEEAGVYPVRYWYSSPAWITMLRTTSMAERTPAASLYALESRPYMLVKLWIDWILDDNPARSMINPNDIDPDLRIATNSILRSLRLKE